MIMNARACYRALAFLCCLYRQLNIYSMTAGKKARQKNIDLPLVLNETRGIQNGIN